jgi:IS30 family transposase
MCRDAKVVLWLLKEMNTTSLVVIKIAQTADEVACQLTDIFCMFGAPFILQSDNGREFANKIIQNLADMWSGMKVVHGKPKHSQSQGSAERSNEDVRDMLVAWVSDNNTKTWSEGPRFIQSKEHRVLHSGIKTSPY